MTNKHTLTSVPVSVMSDFYKITHRLFYPENTTEIYSTWTPRSSTHFPIETDYAVAFGFQLFVKKYLIDLFQKEFFNRTKEDIVSEYKYVIENTLGGTADASHLEALHDLGYLPLEIKALPEGTRVPMKVPSLTIQNTLPEFFWLTNYFETLMSSELWLPSNSATVASHYRRIMDKWATQTTGSTEGVDFQGHDFSFRGMEGLDSAISSGLGHLLSFKGTDNIPSIVGAELYYHTRLDKEFIAGSVSATEHSIMSAYGKDELAAFSTIIDRVPEGIVSIVSDTYDFWNVLETVIPSLKDKIMNRNGKVVLRPDSGVPADIICGTAEYDMVLKTDEKYRTIDDFQTEILTEAGKITFDITENYDAIFKVKLDNTLYFVPIEYRKDKGSVPWHKIREVEETAEEKGAIQLLWEIFGGTITDKGYKLLDTHIGLLYGDAITLKSIEDIFERLAEKGFASTNIVVGIGSYSYTYSTRDSLGYALKATYAKINGEETFIQKDPKTDKDHLKRSLTGKVAVVKNEEGKLVAVDHLTDNEEVELKNNLLQTIFKNGNLVNKETFTRIKERLTKKEKAPLAVSKIVMISSIAFNALTEQALNRFIIFNNLNDLEMQHQEPDNINTLFEDYFIFENSEDGRILLLNK